VGCAGELGASEGQGGGEEPWAAGMSAALLAALEGSGASALPAQAGTRAAMPLAAAKVGGAVAAWIKAWTEGRDRGTG